MSDHFKTLTAFAASGLLGRGWIPRAVVLGSEKEGGRRTFQ